MPPDAGPSPYEQFAAFDAAWQEAANESAEPAASLTPPLPLDVESLGSGHADEPWATDIVAADATPRDASADAGVPTWLLDDVEPTSAETADASHEVTGGEAEPPTVNPVAPAATESVSVDTPWAEVTRARRAGAE
jgi:hypothetical protein